MNWKSLSIRFLDIIAKRGNGLNKSDSGTISITFDQNKKVNVALGTYDISFWPRQTHLGPFNNEDEAREATAQKLDEAERDIGEDTDCYFCQSHLDNEGNCSCAEFNDAQDGHYDSPEPEIIEDIHAGENGDEPETPYEARIKGCLCFWECVCGKSQFKG